MSNIRLKKQQQELMLEEGIPLNAAQNKFFGRVEKKLAVVKVEYVPEKAVKEPSPPVSLGRDNASGSHRSPKATTSVARIQQ